MDFPRKTVHYSAEKRYTNMPVKSHSLPNEKDFLYKKVRQVSSIPSLSLMAYVEKGFVKSKRSIWRLSTITAFFWAIMNFIGTFFATMFSMEKSDAYKRSSGSSKKWDGGPGGGGPGSGPYGNGPRGPPRGLDNVRGIDHSSLPACGSCCGG